MEPHAKEIQKNYYAQTATKYDNQHLTDGDEHFLALHHLEGLVKFNDIKTILDVGAGTGRVALYLKRDNPKLQIISVEPVKELRAVGHAKGLTESELVDGDIYSLGFADSSFDLVCAFGVFHHLDKPLLALKEMQRISAHSIFISDTNNFGQGSPLARFVKQLINFIGLWKTAIYLKTQGKNYTISEGDGLAYSFSIFNLVSYLKRNWSLYFLSTVPSQTSLFRSATHLALFAKKKK